MAQINLLKQNTSPQQTMGDVTSIVVKVLAVLVVGILGYYGYLYFQVSKLTKQVTTLEQAIAQERSKIGDLTRRDELATRQSQLKEVDKLVAAHVYWTTLLPELAKISLKPSNGYYTSISAKADGTINLTLKSPDLDNIDKFLQIFDTPAVYKNFKNVNISGLGKEQVGTSVIRTVDLRFQYNPDLLKYKDQYTSRR